MKQKQIRLIKRAARLIGSKAALARAINTTPQTVQHWLQGHSKELPAWAAVRIDSATEGKIKKHELRPDLFDEAA